MDITRRSDYACRILRAAYKGAGTYVSVAEVAEEESIPYAFARGIQHDLVKSGLVKTIRGAHGGLMLNCDPKRITLLEVLEAVQGPVTVSVCVEDESCCDQRDICAYFQVWRGADKLLQEYLASITLEDLFKMSGEHPAIKRALDGGKASSVSKKKKALAKKSAAAKNFKVKKVKKITAKAAPPKKEAKSKPLEKVVL